MLRETISFIRYNLFLVCLFVTISCGIILFSEYNESSGVGSTQFFIALYTGFCVQNAILSGTGRVQLNRGMAGFGSYIWKNILILLVVIGIGIGVPLAFGAVSFSRGLFAIFYPLLLALVGTWPTAGIAGSTSGLAEAFAGGRRNFLPTFLRLFAGMILPPIVSFLLIAIAASMSYEADAVFQGGKISLITLALLIVSQSTQTFGICYASTVLAHKFQMSEGGPQAGTVPATNVSEIFE
ncbi:hypothetical protein NXC14_CH00194 [Rhizobium sp. NXC14]|uniref:hypothetical protein n=1 Tax=Rhizobium sp. NXC14 TaxID=1981173 RepID=UPI000A20515C|nr:hypothetical protein [Rhizobium sp. NXC14]ARO28209.1 hypothetical protein NXC14_CH00194 [Rhizobium sp. NXC14]